jgi:TRAP-type transport system small permease protein
MGEQVPPGDLSPQVLAAAGIEPVTPAADDPAARRPPARWAARLERALDQVIALLLAVCAVTLIWQVFGRYVLGHSPSWSEEVARMAVAWLTMLGAAACLRDGGHIAVTSLVDALPPGPKAVVLWIRDFAVLTTAGVLVWAGIDFARLNQDQESAALEIPMSVPYASLVVGAALVALMLVLSRLGGEVGQSKAADW